MCFYLLTNLFLSLKKLLTLHASQMSQWECYHLLYSIKFTDGYTVLQDKVLQLLVKHGVVGRLLEDSSMRKITNDVISEIYAEQDTDRSYQVVADEDGILILK